MKKISFVVLPLFLSVLNAVNAGDDTHSKITCLPEIQNRGQAYSLKSSPEDMATALSIEVGTEGKKRLVLNRNDLTDASQGTLEGEVTIELTIAERSFYGQRAATVRARHVWTSPGRYVDVTDSDSRVIFPNQMQLTSGFNTPQAQVFEMTVPYRKDISKIIVRCIRTQS